jgi:hypothetical protein
VRTFKVTRCKSYSYIRVNSNTGMYRAHTCVLCRMINTTEVLENDSMLIVVTYAAVELAASVSRVVQDVRLSIQYHKDESKYLPINTALYFRKTTSHH